MPLPFDTIFISCRRIDFSSAVDRLTERIRRAFGNGMIFVSVSPTKAGEESPGDIGCALASAEMGLIVVQEISGAGHHQLSDSEGEWRAEVEKLLMRRDVAGEPIPIIALIIGGAEEELLGQLRTLPQVDFWHLPSDDQFGNNVDQLIGHMGQIFAVRRVREAAERSWTDLDLSVLALNKLPDSTVDLTQLRTLHVFANQLAELPESFSQLKQLRSINASGNQLTALPSCLGQLSELRSLSVIGNQLTGLPESLCQLTKLRTLFVFNNRLTALPESFGQLAELRSLNVSDNHLTSLPESLGHLTQLRSLMVRNNQLKELPKSLSQLAALRSLDVSGNQLALTESLGDLVDLQSLDVSNNRLASLPESLGQLSRLQTLDISNNDLFALMDSVDHLTHLQSLKSSNNRLVELPEGLDELTQLRNLDVSENQLTMLPENLGDLSQLRNLDVSENQLTMLPESLGELKQLRCLDVSNNQLTMLPESLGELPSLEELYLHGCESLRIPRELLGPTRKEVQEDRKTFASSPALILDYYFRTRRGRRPLNEAKLILVGRGGVGKTCLIKRMINDTFDEHEPETPGINIQPWGIMLPEGDEVRLHVWDFGGQRILHGTHQFFLTERTLYLLVLAGREDSATQDAEYWLQLIKSFGGESRVIVALNKTYHQPFDVNRGLLLEKYPFIADFVKTDCKDPTLGLLELRHLIHLETEALEHRKTSFPADWFTIKEHLATMPRSFISWDEYQRICHDMGETNVQAQRDLARFLHILGIALNYADDARLRDTRVLKPTWVTEGLYTLLRAGQKQNTGGVLLPADLVRALDAEQYPTSKHNFLLRLMEKFQLCFRMSGREERYLVPELLDENQPDLKELLDTPGLGFRYQYEVLPEGLLPRFIVQTHVHSEGNPYWRWRTGVTLERDGCRGLVRADIQERRVDIHIVGAEARRRGLLAIIRAAFDEQHRDLKGLAVDERVPIPGEPGVTESYRHLLQLEDEGEEWCRPAGTKQRVQLKDLLNGLESEDSRAQRRYRGRTDEAFVRGVGGKGDNRMKMTVVELDLVGYSTISDNLEQGLDVSTVAQLNEQIQSFIDKGLKAVGAARDQTVMATTGDGAILVFRSASNAHQFARDVHEATRQHNRSRMQPSAKRVFRTGIATGEIVMQLKPGGGFDIAGTTIARAVRLEAKALPGGILVDEETFLALEPNERHQYGPKQIIAGKRNEKFEAYACHPNDEGATDAGFFNEQATGKVDVITTGFGRNQRREVLEHFKRLRSNQYDDLIFLLEIPISQRPPGVLNLDQQKTQVLKWAEEDDSLDLLLDVLREMMEPLNPAASRAKPI